MINKKIEKFQQKDILTIDYPFQNTVVTVHAMLLLEDNYSYIIASGGKCIIIDPSESDIIASLVQYKNYAAVSIAITHEHEDHFMGLSSLLKKLPECKVYSPITSEILTECVVEDIICRGVFLNHPGHTFGSRSLYFYEIGVLFCGDTLFAGGCGKVKKENIKQLYFSHSALSHLPGDTHIFCGHEYYYDNYKFSKEIGTLQLTECNSSPFPSLPIVLSEELKTNPFLRLSDPTIIELCGKKCDMPWKRLQNLRILKDQFVV